MNNKIKSNISFWLLCYDIARKFTNPIFAFFLSFYLYKEIDRLAEENSKKAIELLDAWLEEDVNEEEMKKSFELLMEDIGEKY